MSFYLVDATSRSVLRSAHVLKWRWWLEQNRGDAQHAASDNDKHYRTDSTNDGKHHSNDRTSDNDKHYNTSDNGKYHSSTSDKNVTADCSPRIGNVQRLDGSRPGGSRRFR